MEIRVLSPLEKVFLDEEPTQSYNYTPKGFKNETISFQVAYYQPDTGERYNTFCNVDVKSDIIDSVRIRRVANVPVTLPVYSDADDDYLRRTPGLYPDRLEDLADCRTRALPGQWNALWIDVEGAPIGTHDIEISISLPDGLTASARTSICVIDAELPKQELIYTRWLHCDAIAQYYNIEVFSELFWEYLRNFISAATKRGVNAMLVPIHTPPLDTAVGGERLTVQLVDIYRNNGAYTFKFDRLRRFIQLCRDCGVEYFEMAHLFTQWGAEHAPKIIVEVEGVRQKLFGWDTDATSSEYATFLGEYITALKSELNIEGVLDKTIWHISDEPSFAHLESYSAAKAIVMPYLDDQYILDALSDVRFYKTGAVEHPVPANNHVHDFIDAHVDGLWTYYCCSQYKKVSNQFIAMPSCRERILAVQLYKYNIVGFLHWGYNFYNSQYSHYTIDPYGNTDGDGFVPAGDTFQVYPGKDGKPVESMRMMVFNQCLDDLRAFKLLESLTSREHVLELIQRESDMDITFDDYPRNAEFVLRLRDAVNSEIARGMRI